MLLHDLTRRFVEWARINNDIKRLERLDEHLLADVGVRRKDIVRFVRDGR